MRMRAMDPGTIKNSKTVRLVQYLQSVPVLITDEGKQGMPRQVLWPKPVLLFQRGRMRHDGYYLKFTEEMAAILKKRLKKTPDKRRRR